MSVSEHDRAFMARVAGYKAESHAEAQAHHLALLLEIQAAKTPLQRAVVDRAVTTASGLRVATVEDLIVLELIADRPKDQGDLDGLSRLPGIDWRYIERWAQEWGIEQRLGTLRAASST